MATRLQLHTLLTSIMGSTNVYFQPPETVKLLYPCIIYSRYAEDIRFANDKPYNQQVRYTLMVIDKNPDSELPGKISSLPLCIFDRHYTKDNLNHDIYNIYY